jgi:hypothetical protein
MERATWEVDLPAVSDKYLGNQAGSRVSWKWHTTSSSEIRGGLCALLAITDERQKLYNATKKLVVLARVKLP